MMFNIFGGIMAKVSAVFGVALGVALLFIKWQSGKIEKQKQKIKGFTKKAEIRKEMKTAKKTVLAKEKAKIKEVESDDKQITIDDINNL